MRQLDVKEMEAVNGGCINVTVDEWAQKALQDAGEWFKNTADAVSQEVTKVFESEEMKTLLDNTTLSQFFSKLFG
ncbi:hypothetical protein SOASR030_19840 [Leminorella grimontii]|uniref:Bacteriocin n=1 Tax=Leminorella grimontii TaxID=82981 RepID=A0AAV5N596_9GAMM|nr:hypothetical protein [Leminorella grimontii]KFC93433.1 hypothetical protein GLGR_2996 [Leminorella grimontii ATCC 33999 = DSM 5078]GKX55872.1 hypothetical protein SOASR030_19840 [Leminorella grimontii]GKX59674.1 hypothetical protein SOASR031_19890 [Leminorella grimontii]VFS54993.1 Uncharacterised protein [Leminorella grimontii]